MTSQIRHQNKDTTSKPVIRRFETTTDIISKDEGLGHPRSLTLRLPGTDVVIAKGDVVSIPVWSLHHDQRYWPEPEKFDPTRFFPENKDRIVSGTYLPFGLGPRNCIAMRFALMEAKLALARTVLEFELRCAPGHEELEFSLVPGIMRPKDDVFVTLTPVAKE